jgi:hypothetical protein
MVLMNISKEFCNNQKLMEVTKAGMAAVGVRCDGGKQAFICDQERKILKLSRSARKMFGIVNGDDTHVQLTIDHDTGKSCFEAQAKVKRQFFSASLL